MSELLPVLILPYSNFEAQSAELFFKRLYGLDDAPVEAEVSDVPDQLDKFLEDAHIAAALHLGPSSHQHVHNFQIEAQERDEAIANHYKRIAKEAEKITPPAGTDPQALAKRASDGDTRKILRTEVTR